MNLVWMNQKIVSETSLSVFQESDLAITFQGSILFESNLSTDLRQSSIKRPVKLFHIGGGSGEGLFHVFFGPI